MHKTSDSSTSRQDEDSVIPKVGTGPRVELVEKPLLAEKVTVLCKLGKASEASSLEELRQKAPRVCHQGPQTARGRKLEESRGHPAVVPPPLVGGLGSLGVLWCAAARTRQNPSSPRTCAFPWEQLAALGWVVCSSYFYGTYHHGTYLL